MRKTKKPKEKPDQDVTVIEATSMPELLEKTMAKLQQINAKQFEAWLDDTMSKLLAPDIYLAAHGSGGAFHQKVQDYMVENEIHLEIHPDGRARVVHKGKIVSNFQPIKGIMIDGEFHDARKEYDGYQADH